MQDLKKHALKEYQEIVEIEKEIFLNEFKN
jgi:hypothetical protein